MQVTSSIALDLNERLLVKHKIKLTVDVIYGKIPKISPSMY